MSELKEIVEKFIELDDDLNAKIEEALGDSEELPESFEEDNTAQSMKWVKSTTASNIRYLMRNS